MTPYEVPLTNTPQKVVVDLAGVAYQLLVQWNGASACWILDINNQDGTPILQGVPLVTGVNLLDQFDYLDIGGALYAQTDGDVNVVPTFDNLGTEGHLYFVTSP